MNPKTSHFPLCVDLDGTLVCNDTSWKSFYALLKKNPFFLLKVPFHLIKGRAYLKQQISKYVQLPISDFTFHPDFLTWLKEQKKQGRELALVTGADQSVAETVANHLKIFDHVFASDGKINLTGKNKKAKLVAHYGEKKFAYAGNSFVDLAVWPYAAEAIVVNAHPNVLEKARKTSSVTHVFKTHLLRTH